MFLRTALALSVVCALGLAGGCARQAPPPPTPAAETPPEPAPSSAEPAPTADEAAVAASADAAATPTPATPPASNAKALFEAKCSKCHKLTRATHHKETAEKWAEIVKEMQGKKKGWISDAEAATIVDHLAKEYGK